MYTVAINTHRIGLKGAQALSELLQSNQVLTLIDLSDNGLSQEGLTCILSSINPFIVSLNLSSNDISSAFPSLLSLFA